MTTEQKTSTDKLPSPEKELRADLWHSMSVTQLHRQQDLLLDRLNKIRSMSSSTMSVIGLQKVLEQAMIDITRLIDMRSTPAPKPTPPQGKPNGE